MKKTLLYYLMALLLYPSDASAMHISEGILPLGWAVLWFAIAIPALAYGLWRLKKISSVDISFKPFVGLIVAVVFIISCMPVPVPTAGTSSHPTGVAISAILLGPAVSVVTAGAALLIQAVFLAHGGLTTLGANIVSMGIVGSISGYVMFKLVMSIFNGTNKGLAVSGFIAGIFADWATYTMTSIQLASGIMGDSQFMPLFKKILFAFIPTQLPLGILEGAMTAGMITLLYKKRPDILIKMKVLKVKEVAI